MTSPTAALRDAPREVIDFLNRSSSMELPHVRIKVLSLARSNEYSSALQATSVGDLLGLIALTEANDSNPYCYISRGPATGMVVHYIHDDAPTIRFASFADFKHALLDARYDNPEVGELPFSPLPIAGSSLAVAVADLAQADDDDSEFLLCLFIPSLSPSDLPLLDVLSLNPSFFVREALALFIAAHPIPAHAQIATRLAADPVPQVARPGRQAAAAVDHVSQRS